MSIPDVPSPQEAEKAFRVPVFGRFLRAAIGLIGFFHILKGDSTGLAIQLNNTTKKLKMKSPVSSFKEDSPLEFLKRWRNR